MVCLDNLVTHFKCSQGVSAVFPLNHNLLYQTFLYVLVKMLVKYNQQQNYIKLDALEGQFEFLKFHEKRVQFYCSF